MTITPLLKENWKEDKAELQKSVSLLEKEITEYKEERKSNWKLFKNKFHNDLNKLKKNT